MKLKLVTSDVIDVKAGKLYVSDVEGYKEYPNGNDDGTDDDDGQQALEDNMDFIMDDDN